MQNDRPIQIAAFLDQQGWADAHAQIFDGDFSPRRYARLTGKDGRSAILMDADADQKTPQFVSVANILRKCNVHAPEIYGAAPDQGLVLMQDFGRRNIGALWDNGWDNGADARPFFLRAAELLAHLHACFDRAMAEGIDLPLFNADLFAAQAALFLDAYLPLARQRDAGAEEREDFTAAWQAALRPVETMPKSLLLRDFMPDNLMELSGGALGVLDFQDAGIGPTAYDLASLCEEVRRDGGFAFLPDVVAHYRDICIKQGGEPPGEADLTRACIILSAQRHTRILGIVARQALRLGKRDKLELLPRIKQHLSRLLKQSYLMPVREWMERSHVLS